MLGRGHRQPYIVLGLLVQAICLMIAPFVNPGRFFWEFAVLAFVMMSGMALYDTCTDGLALDTTPPDERGRIQGVMVGGRALGVVIVSVVIGALAQSVSWTVAFWTLALITLLPLFLVLRVHEAPRPVGRRFQWGAFGAFAQWPVIALGLLGALYSLVINAANQIVNPFLQQAYGIDLLAAGLYTAVWGIGVVLGGLTGGRFADRIGQRRAVVAAMIIAIIATLGLTAITSSSMAWPLVLIFGLAFGYYETVYFATSMTYSDLRIAASMFAILMAIANLGTGIGVALSGALVDTVGYRPTFAIIAALNLLALPLIPAIFGRRRGVETENVKAEA